MSHSIINYIIPVCNMKYINLLTFTALFLICCKKQEELPPYSPDFTCDKIDSTVRTYLNQTAVIHKVKIQDTDLYLLSLKLVSVDGQEMALNLIPSMRMDAQFEKDSLIVSFNGEQKNCVVYQPFKDMPNCRVADNGNRFIVPLLGYKVVINNIQKR